MLRPPNRFVALLVACVAFAATGVFSAITLGAIEAVNLAGSRAAAGVPGALAILGAASGSFVLGLLMQRRGRRFGLATGWSIAAVGGLIGAWGVERHSFSLVLVAMFAIGSGNGGSQLARYAATETVGTALRARALSWVVWANAIGAVVGPLSLGRIGGLSEARGIEPGAGGFAMVAGAFVVAAALSRLYRPPAPAPPAVPAVVQPQPLSEAHASARRRDLDARAVWIAVACLVVAQASMVMVMSITPVHLSGGGHAYGVVGMVMGGHFVGMFGFAPLVGWLVDRLHPNASIRIGLLALASGAALAGVLPIGHGPALAVPLMLVGVGWCVCFVGASTAVAAATSSGTGAALQGRLDSLVWTFSAASSVSAGLLLWLTSYPSVAMMAIALVAGCGLITLVPREVPRPA